VFSVIIITSHHDLVVLFYSDSEAVLKYLYIE
jgi:hypothetical protein